MGTDKMDTITSGTASVCFNNSQTPSPSEDQKLVDIKQARAEGDHFLAGGLEKASKSDKERPKLVGLGARRMYRPWAIRRVAPGRYITHLQQDLESLKLKVGRKLRQMCIAEQIRDELRETAAEMDASTRKLKEEIEMKDAVLMEMNAVEDQFMEVVSNIQWDPDEDGEQPSSSQGCLAGDCR